MLTWGVTILDVPCLEVVRTVEQRPFLLERRIEEVVWVASITGGFAAVDECCVDHSELFQR